MRDETREVLNMLMHSFPSLGSWFAKQDASLSETWSKVLSHVDPEDAMSVVERFIRGDLELPANYEYDRLAIIIRREAAEMARRRAELAENDRRRMEQEHARTEAMGWLKYSGQVDETNEVSRWIVSMRAVIRNGELLKQKRLSREECDELHRRWKKYHQHGGEMPQMVEVEA